MRHRWLPIAAIVCAASVRAQTPPPPAQPAPPKPPPSANVQVPDDGLIEFLGSDDVGDAAWWEFLKRARPRGTSPPPPPPPQEAKR
jgi:hypothetical protein